MLFLALQGLSVKTFVAGGDRTLLHSTHPPEPSIITFTIHRSCPCSPLVPSNIIQKQDLRMRISYRIVRIHIHVLLNTMSVDLKGIRHNISVPPT